MPIRKRIFLSIAATLVVAASTPAVRPVFQAVQAHPQAAAGSPASAPVQVRAVASASTQSVTLAGNVHPLARLQAEIGAVDSQARLNSMMLLLKPSPAQQADLDALVEGQHDPRSPLFHQWLTPEEYGARFGIGDEDLERVEVWLLSEGSRSTKFRPAAA